MLLPGPVFMFQGDELGMTDGPGVQPPLDRAGRDRFRHPMQWDASEHGGFTRGRPWLPVIDPAERNAAAQERDPSSWLHLLKRLVRLRRGLAPEARFREAAEQMLVLERGDYTAVVNLGEQPAPVDVHGEVVIEARPGDAADREAIPPRGGWIARS
jgi:alpha-glucosidase